MIKKIKKWFLRNDKYFYTAIGVAYVAILVTILFAVIVYVCSRIV